MSKRRQLTEVHLKRRQAAKELSLPITDWHVVKLATALVNYDGIQARLAAGELVATDEIVKAEALVAEARASAEPPPTVNLKICQTLTGICPVCKAEIDLGPLPPISKDDGKSPPEPRKPPPPASGPPPAASGELGGNAAPKAKPGFGADNVVPIRSPSPASAL